MNFTGRVSWRRQVDRPRKVRWDFADSLTSPAAAPPRFGKGRATLGQYRVYLALYESPGHPASIFPVPWNDFYEWRWELGLTCVDRACYEIVAARASGLRQSSKN